MSIHGSELSMYASCRLYVRTIFPNTWCILYMVVFACEFPGEAGLALIPFSCSIKLLLNSWQRNSPPWSYVISAGHVYWTSHVVTTRFSIVIDFLSLYCLFPNHPVTGYIVVTYFTIRGSLHFLRILWGPMRSTHSLFCGISYASLSVILPYFNIDRFVCWHMPHSMTSLWTSPLMCGK